MLLKRHVPCLFTKVLLKRGYTWWSAELLSCSQCTLSFLPTVLLKRHVISHSIILNFFECFQRPVWRFTWWAAKLLRCSQCTLFIYQRCSWGMFKGIHKSWFFWILSAPCVKVYLVSGRNARLFSVYYVFLPMVLLKRHVLSLSINFNFSECFQRPVWRCTLWAAEMLGCSQCIMSFYQRYSWRGMF